VERTAPRSSPPEVNHRRRSPHRRCSSSYDAHRQGSSRRPWTNVRRTMSPAGSADGGAAPAPVHRGAGAAGATGSRLDWASSSTRNLERMREVLRSGDVELAVAAIAFRRRDRRHEHLADGALPNELPAGREAAGGLRPCASSLLGRLAVTAELERIGDLALRVVEAQAPNPRSAGAPPARGRSTSSRRWPTTRSSAYPKTATPASLVVVRSRSISR